MAQFDIITEAPTHIRQASDVIDQKYFSLDTADESTIHSWNDYNRHAFTASLLDGRLVGYFTALPISKECATLLDAHKLSEEDLRVDHILPQESIRHAEFSYIPVIAIGDTKNYIHRQCVASLTVGLASLFLNAYDPKRLKRIYVNPTTFEGNNFVRRMGFRPLRGHKLSMSQSDTYYVDFNDEIAETYRRFIQRYDRFIRSNVWGDTTKKDS